MLLRAAGEQALYLKMAEVLHTLPWLPAFDRRDIITCKAVLENVQQHLNGMAPSSDTDAFAASIYVASLLRPSPGDAIKGRSVRAWLAEIGITLYEGSQANNHLVGDPSRGQDDSPGQATPIPEADWLDSAPSGALLVSSATSASQSKRHNYESKLTIRELRHLGWLVDVGLRTSIRTPAGTIMVLSRARSQRGWCIGAIKVLPQRRITMAIVSPLLLMLAITQFIRFVRFPCEMIAPLWTNEVTYSAASLLLLCALLADDLRAWHFPLPVPQSGRLEFCSVMGALAFFMSPYLVWPEYLRAYSCSDCGMTRHAHAEDYLSFFYGLNSVLFALYIAFITGVNALAAAVRYRNWRYLFALTAHGSHEFGYPVL